MRRRRRRDDDGEDQVAAECAAFLTGTLVERLEADGRAIPVWAWTNLLAHGSARADRRIQHSAVSASPAASELVDCPGSTGRSDSRDDAWSVHHG